MAAGDRNRNGKPTDLVRHMWGNNLIKTESGEKWDGKTLCGRLDVGYASDDYKDVTCLKCLSKLEPKEKEV